MPGSNSPSGATTRLHHFVGGKPMDSGGGRRSNILDPATGETTGTVQLAGAAEVAAAVEDAERACADWARTPPVVRARVLFRYKDLLEKNKEALARLISAEHGKLLPDAAAEVARGIEHVEFACGIPHLLKGEFSENVGTNVDCYAMRQPLGVCAGITPFNFPVMVPLCMFSIAIACGNSFVLKPSERAPSAPLRLAELLMEAGAPPGILNVVNGDKEAVDAILAHPGIAAVSFIGSTPVAAYVYRTSAEHNKRVQALGGAKNHMVILPDADIEQATDALMGAAYGAAGERCMAISVAVAVGDSGDALVERLRPRVRGLRLGPYTDPDAEMGPLVSREAHARVRGYVDLGVEEGAELVVDGRDVRLQGYENGFFLGGSLFDRVEPRMRIYRDEIFGPVLCVVRAETYEAALAMTNAHELGNGAAIFTRDGDAARNFAARVNAGMVGVNLPIPVPPAQHSFGGWKRSMFGDHDVYGPEALRFYTRLKTVTSRWPTGIRAGAEFVMPTMR